MACDGSQSCRKDGCQRDGNGCLRVEKESVPTVVFIGRLSANKRPEHAIRAFGLVRRQLPDAQMWVIGSGPEEARLRRIAGPGVTFLGRVSEEEKRERLARAHALVATSVREGWGLVVTEAAASGTVSIGYDVPGLRDSIGASGGVLTRADPASLASGLVGLLSSVVAGDGPGRSLPESSRGRRSLPASSLWRTSPSRQRSRFLTRPDRLLAAGLLTPRERLSRVRVGLGVLGVALLLLGGMRGGTSPILVGAAFSALLAATAHRGRRGLADTRRAPQFSCRLRRGRPARGAGTWPSRIGLAIVALVARDRRAILVRPGRLLAGGDLSPVVGTAWLGRLFAPWSWSGSNLGGPAANETSLPWAAVYWLVHALRGSPALARRHLVHRALRWRGGGLLSALAGPSSRPGRLHPRRSRLCLQRPRCHYRNQPGIPRRYGPASRAPGDRA